MYNYIVRIHNRQIRKETMKKKKKKGAASARMLDTSPAHPLVPRDSPPSCGRSRSKGPLCVARLDRVRPKVNLQRALKHSSGRRPFLVLILPLAIDILDCERRLVWSASPTVYLLGYCSIPMNRVQKEGGCKRKGGLSEGATHPPPSFLLSGLPEGGGGGVTSQAQSDRCQNISVCRCALSGNRHGE